MNQTDIQGSRRLRLLIKYKAVLFTLIGIVIFFIGLISAAIFFDYKELIKQARVTAKNNSYSLDQYIQSVFNKIDLSIKSASRDIHLSDRKNEKLPLSTLQMLDFYKSQLSEVHAFRIANSDGKVIVNTDRNVPENISIEDREYFNYHKTNSDSQLYISNPIKSKFDGKMVITLSRRIPSAEKRFVGIVYAVVTINSFHNFFSTIDIGKAGHITLISLDEHIILYRFPANENVFGQKLNIHPESLKLISEKQASGEWEQVSNIDGMRKTFAARVNYQFNYMIATGLAKDDYLERWKFNLIPRGIVFLVFTLVLIFGFIKYVNSQERIEVQQYQIYENARRVAISRISTGVAHEINNPLAIISGKSEVIKVLIESEAPKSKVMKMLKDIDSMVTRAAKIVKCLQELDQESPAKMGIFSLNEILENSVAILTQKMSDNAIEVSIEKIPKIEIKGHKGQLAEVLIHLISNSIDAIQNTEKKWIEISFKIQPGHIFVMFTDAGTGIAENEVRQLTDPFFTTKDPGCGVGLGLSVSDSIVRAHGGSLSYNASSKNTQFILKLNIENYQMLAG